MTTPTSNPVPSNQPQDLLFNAEALDYFINSTSPTFATRVSGTRPTIAGYLVVLDAKVADVEAKRVEASADIDGEVSSVEEKKAEAVDLIEIKVGEANAEIEADLLAVNTEAAAYLARLGYDVPVAYAAGQTMSSPNKTVSYGGDVYAPKVADIPFTTSGVFETAKFRLIQGIAGVDLAGRLGGGMVGNLGGTVAKDLVQVRPRLANWRRGGVRGKKIAVVGNSKADMLFTSDTIPLVIVPKYTGPAGSLPGVTFANFGASGSTLDVFLANGPAGRGYSDVVTYAPDLILWLYDMTNERRSGSKTVAQMIALATTAFEQFRRDLPNTDIVIVTANSFLTTDVGAHGYVVPNSKAQDYSDDIKLVWDTIQNLYPNIYTMDVRKLFSADTAQASSLSMQDQIHWSNLFMRYYMTWLVDNVIGQNALEFSEGRTAYPFGSKPQAELRGMNYGILQDTVNNVGYRLAPTVYPLAVLSEEDYFLVAAGNMSTTAGNSVPQLNVFQGQDPVWPKFGSIGADDVVVQVTDAGIFACLVPYTGNSTNNGNVTLQLANMGAAAPYAVVASGNNNPCFIYRNKYGHSANAKLLAAQTAQYPASAQFRVAASANGSITLEALRGGRIDSQWTFQAGDVLAFQDIANITLTAAMAVAANSGAANFVVSEAGKNFTTTSTICTVFGVGPRRAESNLATPLRVDVDGLISGLILDLGVYKINRVLTRSGRYQRFAGRLDVPDGSNPTIVVVRATVNTALVTVATITFAAGSNNPTIAYNFGGAVPLPVGVRLQFEITPGGSTVAGLHLCFDQ